MAGRVRPVVGAAGPIVARTGCDRPFAAGADRRRCGVESASGDVDAEVAGEPGQAVGVALPDGAEAPGSVSAVDLEQTSAVSTVAAGWNTYSVAGLVVVAVTTRSWTLAKRPPSTLTAATIRWTSGLRLSVAMWSVSVEVAPRGVVAVWRTAPSGVAGWL